MKYLSLIIATLLLISIGSSPLPAQVTGTQKPNILLIPIDDLNDWVGVLGGHPQAKTPNIDSLAAQGVLFTNAHCQAPLCYPSRLSMLSSTYPETPLHLPPPNPDGPEKAMKYKFLMDRFQEEDYAVSGAGKIFHGGTSPSVPVDLNVRFVPNYAGRMGGFGPQPANRLAPPYEGMVGLWDWGAYPTGADQPYTIKEQEMPDYKIAAWAVKQLKNKPEQPFFLASGFFRPHVPLYAPQKYFDMFPQEDLQLPKVIADDLKDIPDFAVEMTHKRHAPPHDWVLENDQWKPLVQAYLACVAFVDAQVGKVLQALRESPYADNTIIVLYADHGFHLGEKELYEKLTIWEESTQVPLIIVAPGMEGGQVCSKPVQLLDIYPTLLELADLEADPKLEGNSLVPLLKDPQADWPHMARTSLSRGNMAFRSEHYRYIIYADGSEEFYDHKNDPQEWHNLIGNPDYAEQIEQHRKAVPKDLHPLSGKSSGGRKAKETGNSGASRD